MLPDKLDRFLDGGTMLLAGFPRAVVGARHEFTPIRPENRGFSDNDGNGEKY